MVTNLTETAGYALVIAFLYCVWPPLALLGGGLLLIVFANTRAARTIGARGRTVAAVGAALAAARSAYRQPPATDVNGQRALVNR